MLELTLIQKIVIWVLPVLFAITVHEVAHGWMAGRLGDKTDAQSLWLRGIEKRRGFNTACVALAHKNARQAWAIMAREQALAV